MLGMDEREGEVGDSTSWGGGRAGGDAPFFLVGRTFGLIQYLEEC